MSFIHYISTSKEPNLMKVKQSRDLVPKILDYFDGKPYNYLIQDATDFDIMAINRELRLYGFQCRGIEESEDHKYLMLKVWRSQDGEFEPDNIPIFEGLNGGETSGRFKSI